MNFDQTTRKPFAFWGARNEVSLHILRSQKVCAERDDGVDETYFLNEVNEMVKRVDSMVLDTSKLRDLAGSLRVLESKSLELVPIIEGLAEPFIQGHVISPQRGKWITEGGVGVLEKELAVLQAALNDTRRRIGPALKTLKKSLQ